MDDIAINIYNKGHQVFLDMEKAFLQDLKTMSNTPPLFVKMIQSFFTDRKYQIEILDHLSTTRNIVAGLS